MAALPSKRRDVGRIGAKATVDVNASFEGQYLEWLNELDRFAPGMDLASNVDREMLEGLFDHGMPPDVAATRLERALNNPDPSRYSNMGKFGGIEDDYARIMSPEETNRLFDGSGSKFRAQGTVPNISPAIEATAIETPTKALPSGNLSTVAKKASKIPTKRRIPAGSPNGPWTKTRRFPTSTPASIGEALAPSNYAPATLEELTTSQRAAAIRANAIGRAENGARFMIRDHPFFQSPLPADAVDPRTALDAVTKARLAPGEAAAVVRQPLGAAAYRVPSAVTSAVAPVTTALPGTAIEAPLIAAPEGAMMRRGLPTSLNRGVGAAESAVSSGLTPTPAATATRAATTVGETLAPTSLPAKYTLPVGELPVAKTGLAAKGEGLLAKGKGLLKGKGGPALVGMGVGYAGDKIGAALTEGQRGDEANDIGQFASGVGDAAPLAGLAGTGAMMLGASGPIGWGLAGAGALGYGLYKAFSNDDTPMDKFDKLLESKDPDTRSYYTDRLSTLKAGGASDEEAVTQVASELDAETRAARQAKISGSLQYQVTPAQLQALQSLYMNDMNRQNDQALLANQLYRQEADNFAGTPGVTSAWGNLAKLNAAQTGDYLAQQTAAYRRNFQMAPFDQIMNSQLAQLNATPTSQSSTNSSSLLDALTSQTSPQR